ncbi:MAG: winged helix-turn-helix transcriptional regulator [Candidatus Hadarchaeaceae archaeon]
MEEKMHIVIALDGLLCKRWTLHLLASLSRKQPRRFKEILDDLAGISTKTLSERLRALEKDDIISRKAYSEIPPRVEYSLTKKGMELVRSFDGVKKWAMRWMKS